MNNKRGIDIGVILPTRGLVFTEVEEAIERFRCTTWRNVKVYRTHNIKLPQSQNDLVGQALADGCSHLWFIEEDTVPPEKVFEKLLNAAEGISFVDYGVAGFSCSAQDRVTNEILWCGLGCTMIKRSVFDKVPRPWFRSDKQLRINDMQWIDVDPDRSYGGQDIWFCTKAREAGVKIQQVKGECRHLQFVERGEKEVNNGLHLILDKPRIKVKQIINFNKEEGVDYEHMVSTGS